jgi:hypothetical protein
MRSNEVNQPRWTAHTAYFLLLLCLLRGLWLTRGLESPAIIDTFRDAGFVQGFVDGNWLGDPSIAGAWRYYPPLIHALFAAVVAITGIAPLRLLVFSAPWVNLLVPMGFFLLSRSLLGAPAAACGMALFVLFNGLEMPPWISAAYYPWSSIPILAMAGFFLALWLIHARIRSTQPRDVVLLGSAIGLVFLAHTVPAVILAAILPAAAIAARGLSFKTLGWIAGVGLVATLWSIPFLEPLLVSYRLHMLNLVPGAFTDNIFLEWPPRRGLILTLVPGLLAVPIIIALRSRAMVSRTVAAILAAWIIVPVLFLTRHYACLSGSQSAACTVFVLAVHHWFMYLQAALTVLAGLAAWLCIGRVLVSIQASRVAVAFWTAAAACAMGIMWLRPIDDWMRQRAVGIAASFDWNEYVWLAQHTTSEDRFVTELSDEYLNPGSLAVLSAGRLSVALPATCSNPYVEWVLRYRRSEGYLAAARSAAEQPDPVLCELRDDARSASAYIILPNGTLVNSGSLHREHEGRIDTVYRVLPAACVKQQRLADAHLL